jgi:molecular chaperone GrpE
MVRRKKTDKQEEQMEPEVTSGEEPVEEGSPVEAEVALVDVSGQAEEAGVSEEALSPEEIASLKEKLAEAQAKAEEYLDGWQRALAEFSNYKKRVDRDREAIYQEAAIRVIKGYLDVVDDLERALANRPQDGEGAAWAEGIELIYRKLLGLLEGEGVTPMEVDAQMFDPNLHEAISQEESEKHESGEIIEVVQTGYVLGNRVIRPARVRVAR